MLLVLRVPTISLVQLPHDLLTVAFDLIFVTIVALCLAVAHDRRSQTRCADRATEMMAPTIIIATAIECTDSIKATTL